MGIIKIKEVDCKDCYKCVRFCPLKAIRIKAGHAELVEERCLLDGKCVAVCPNKAKEIEDSLGKVKSFLQSGFKVVGSLAPSFAGLFDYPGQVVSALHKLGFDRVEETAWAAELVAEQHIKMLDTLPKPLITSACPAIISLIEIYYPELIPHLSPVVSPMIAHGRMLKANHKEDIRVVFIGPCIAKKKEMVDVPGAIDSVLTFQELKQWLEEENINIDSLPEEEFANERPERARVFPLEGGLLKTASLSSDMLAQEVMTISGIEKCRECLQDFDKSILQKIDVLEMLACPEGCISGAGIKTESSLLSRRQKLLNFSREKKGFSTPTRRFKDVDLTREYRDRRIDLPPPSEEDIRSIFHSIGKFTPEDERNCGACGYDTCREKAIAVCQGMAEIEMCIPYMRSRADMAEIITRSIPIGIIAVAEDMKVLDMNPAAKKIFCCYDPGAIGSELSRIMEDKYFREVFYTKSILNGEIPYPGGLTLRQALFFVPQHGVALGIFVDITEEKTHLEEINKMRKESFSRVKSVIDKQMRVAQEIAGLLGETTAETKAYLLELLTIFEEK
jgi:iron only hydrogenase large subunit-like protein/arsenate reductase-like glutaredoxin family protein